MGGWVSGWGGDGWVGAERVGRGMCWSRPLHTMHCDMHALLQQAPRGPWAGAEPATVSHQATHLCLGRPCWRVAQSTP